MNPDQPPAPTPNVSETPRTDRKVLTWNLSERELRERQPHQLGYNGTSINGKVVLADFARQLERELAAVTKERDEWKNRAVLLEKEVDTLDASHEKTFVRLTAALARAEKAEEDTRRLDWLMEKIQWHTPLTMYGEVREYRFRTPITTPTINIRKAIDAALTPTKEPTGEKP